MMVYRGEIWERQDLRIQDRRDGLHLNHGKAVVIVWSMGS